MRHAHLRPSRRPGVAWLAVAALLAGGALIVGALSYVIALDAALGATPAAAGGLARRLDGLLDWQPALAASEPWRWWTAAWVHGSRAHLLQNLAGLLLLAWLGVVARVPAPLALAWLLAWPLTQGGWLLGPALAHFFGLSGVLHAGVAIVGLHLLRSPRTGERLGGLLLLAGLAAKLLHEQPFGPLLRAAPDLGIAVAPWSHFSGSVAGLLAAAPVGWVVRMTSKRPARAMEPAPALRTRTR